MEQSIAKLTGISWDKRRNKWLVQIKTDGRCKFLGYFQDIESAKIARRQGEEKYHKPKLETKLKREEDIAADYEKGEKISKIMQKYCADYNYIMNILKNRNINIRPLEKQLNEIELLSKFNETKDVRKLAKYYNVSVGLIYRRLRYLGIKEFNEHKKHFFDQEILKNIDCEWKAYFLGLMFADGNVRKNLRASSITLVEKDKYLLDIFANIFNIKLYHHQPNPIFNKEKSKIYIAKPNNTLTICGKKFCEILNNHGCTPKKSLNLKWPNHLPKEVYSHFIRGYFDGDGYISKNGKVFMIISSDCFCKSFKNFIEKELSIFVKINKCGKVSQAFIWRKKDVLKIKNYMYSNDTISLLRKKERFI